MSLSPCIECILDAIELLKLCLEFCVRRAAGGPGAGTTFNCRPTQQAVMQLVTRYPGVRHRIVHDAAQVHRVEAHNTAFTPLPAVVDAFWRHLAHVG